MNGYLALMQGKNSRFFIGILERQQENGLLKMPERFASNKKAQLALNLFTTNLNLLTYSNFFGI
jgi:hypothetical protein